MGKGHHFDFRNHNPEFERVVEIYNSWGSSETIKKEGNSLPITSKGRTGVNETSDGAIQKALNQGCRFGFVAGGLDDRGIYTKLYDSSQKQYSPGLTAVIAKDLSRQSLIDALYKRSCYATTGERIILGMTIAGFPIGTETNTQDKPGLAMNRHIAGFAAGTTKLKSVEIIRNGKVLQLFNPKDNQFEFTYDDMESLEKVSLQPDSKQPPFSYYYLRVTQDDGQRAWSSPIWVDYHPPKAKAKNKKDETLELKEAGVVEE